MLKSYTFNKHIDYTSVYANLLKYRKKSILFLKNALGKEVNYKLPYIDSK